MKKKISIAQAAFFGIGIVVSLLIMRFVFEKDGALWGGIAGAFGAVIGTALHSVYAKIRGE